MTKRQTLKTIIRFCLAIFLFFVSASFAFAAEILFSAPAHSLRIDDELEVKVVLNTEQEEINALEGQITFPLELLELRGIRDGSSLVNFWVERPIATNGGKIVFSGITPGGYRGDHGLIFSLLFRARRFGAGALNGEQVRVLRNNGQGTSVPVRARPVQLVVSTTAGPMPPVFMEDIEPPEAFVPELVRDPAIFGGQWFLVFATQDKEPGIDHYEVREGDRSFARAESPYLLKNQDLDSEISVRVLDRNGNARIVRLLAAQSSQRKTDYREYAISAILLAVVLAYLARKILWRKRKP